MGTENFDNQTPQTEENITSRLLSRGRVLGAVGFSALAFVGGYSARSVGEASAAPEAAAAAYTGEDTTTAPTTTAETAPLTTAADPNLAETLHNCRNQALEGTISGVLFKVYPNRRELNWAIGIDAWDPSCQKYGKRIVQIYAASFAPNARYKNPHRLGKTITLANPVNNKDYHRKQWLTEAIPRGKVVSDVETSIWAPKPGYGKTEKFTNIGNAEPLGFQQP